MILYLCLLYYIKKSLQKQGDEDLLLSFLLEILDLNFRSMTYFKLILYTFPTVWLSSCSSTIC